MIKFLSNLPDRDRTFYLLMRAYERDMSQTMKFLCSTNFQNYEPKNHIHELSNLYQQEINKVLNYNNSTPIYEPQHAHNDKAEPSEPIPLIREQYDKDEFAENLGEWASSFSDDDDDYDANILQRISQLKLTKSN